MLGPAIAAAFVGAALCPALSVTPAAGASSGGRRPPTLLAATCAGSQGVRGTVAAPGGSYLKDACGRSLILHGVNAVYKMPPFELVDAPGQPYDFSSSDASAMASLGFDVVRLGIIWKGLEPGRPGASPNDPAVCSPGASTDPREYVRATVDAYVAKLEHTVDLLGSYGIYSLIDMHQDVYNELFAGEGAPDWAVCTNGVPPTNTGNWSANYFTPAAGDALNHFWNNDVRGGLQQEYDRVWGAVAARFATNPWVVGYDVFNEPFSDEIVAPGGSAAFDARLECFYTGRATPGTTTAGTPLVCPPTDPAHGAIAAIERSDHNHLVFYEPDVGNDFGQVNWIGAMRFPRLVLDFHDYCLPGSVDASRTSAFVDSACAQEENLVFAQESRARSAAASAYQPGGPAWFLSEFGSGCDLSDLAQVADRADRNLVGWTYWQWRSYEDPTGGAAEGVFDPCPGSGTSGKVRILARPYAQAVAGTPTGMSFDPATGAFAVRYRPDPTVKAPSVVFVPTSVHYPQGYCAVATGARIVAPDGPSTSTHLYLYNRPGAASVQLTLRPGRCA